MDFMGVVNIGLSLQAARQQTEAGVASVKRSLDVQKLQGAMVVELIQSAQIAPPPPGNTGQIVNVTA